MRRTYREREELREIKRKGGEGEGGRGMGRERELEEGFGCGHVLPHTQSLHVPKLTYVPRLCVLLHGCQMETSCR